MFRPGVLLDGDEHAQAHIHINTPLIDAVIRDDVDGVRQRLAAGVRIDGDNSRALHLARSAEVATMLLTAGFDVAAKITGHTPLHFAAMRNGAHVSGVIRVLLAAGARIDELNDRGCSPLHVASASFDPTAARALIDGGADVNFPSRGGSTPIELAASAGAEACCDLLVRAGAVIFERTVLRASVLYPHVASMLAGARARWDDHGPRYWWIVVAVTAKRRPAKRCVVQ